MLEEYKELGTSNGVMYRGSLSFIDLKKFATDLQYPITVKGLRGTATFSTSKLLVSRDLAGRPYYAKSVFRFYINGTPSDKFTDIVKHLQNVGFRSGDDVLIIVDDYTEIVELSDGDLHEKDDDEIVFTYDTNKWVLKDDAFFCNTDREWYESENDLVYVSGEGYYLEDDEDICWCDHCNEYCLSSDTEVHVGNGNTEWWCESCVDSDAFRCDDCGEWWSNDYSYNIDNPSCTVCPSCYDNDYFYCGECSSYVHRDYYNYDEECCEDCAEKHHLYIKSYHWHHCNSYDNKGHLFLKDSHMPLSDSDVKNTCGIELEVDAYDSSNQDECIEALAEYQLDDNEFYYEHDGSLSCGGFEIITAIHTFQSIKSMKWREILRTLRDYGFVSHSGGKCGLHIHVGRKYFGDTENAQNNAIGNIYSFYSLFWDDIVKASRRSSFQYCSNPSCEKPATELKNEIENEPTKARHWAFTKASLKQGHHGLALNNSNYGTFEFRLGRGTLVYESFMAWIDFTLTIAKNSRNISTRGLIDIDNWLSGISKQTAEYLKSRGAFPESNIINKLTVTEGVAICA